MATVEVRSKGGQWVVKRGGVTQSRHRKKSRATQSARRVADTGDRLRVQRADGTIQKNVRVQ